MRPDMYKVIVERPRRGGGESKGRLKERLDYHMDGPERESMKYRHRDRKSLNENLAPLRRFIIKQVGRPWNKVYSEICANINVNNTVQAHIRQHVPDFVAQNVVMIDGKPWKQYRYAQFGPVFEPTYVCPRTGLLRRSPKRTYHYNKPNPKHQQVVVDLLHKYVKIEEIWYLVTFAHIPAAEVWFDQDVVLKCSASNWRFLKEQWGSSIYAVTKQQASKKQIRRDILPKL